MTIGKLVVIDTKSNFEAKLNLGQIPSLAVVFIKDVGQIYAHGTYFGVPKTYNVLTQTTEGLAPKGGTAASSLISNVDTEWVLTVTSGKSPSWRKLPANAFKNDKTIYSASGDGITLSNDTFSLSLNSTTKLDSAIGGLIYAVKLDSNGKLCVLVPWSNSTYDIVTTSDAGLVPAMPTSNSTAISTKSDEWVLTTTKGGTPSWRLLPDNAFLNLKYTFYNLLFKNGDTVVDTYKPTTSPTKTIAAGDNVTISASSNIITISAVDTKYTLPTATSDTLGGVKVGTTLTSTSGYTAVHINNGKLYYKNTTYTTKDMSVNGSSYSIYASENLPTIWAPSSLGSSGLVLKVNDDGTGLIWTNDVNTWTAWAGATSTANGTAGYMPAPTKDLRGQFLRGDGLWVSLNNYSLPTASDSVLGGVKVGGSISETTGYESVKIMNGVIYAKNTTYSSLKNPYSLTLKYNDTLAWTYNGSTAKTLNLKSGSNISITGDTSGDITIANTYSYTLPTASSTLGGVKTSSTVSSTSGLTACPIIEGIVYYKNTTYSTKSMNVNGTNYSIYTSAGSLPTIWAPTALSGTGGYILSTNSAKTALEWTDTAPNATKWGNYKINVGTSSGTDTSTIYFVT